MRTSKGSRVRKTEIERSHDAGRQDIDIIRNREKAELLVMSEVRRAQSEVLLAASSSHYLKHLADLGLIDRMEQAQSNGAKLLVLCSNTVEEKREEVEELFSVIKRYAELSTVDAGIKGTILVIDNDTVLAISEEGIDAVAIYSQNRSLVNNFGSLFESLWEEQEFLRSVVKTNAELLRYANMQNEFVRIAAHELRTPFQPLLTQLELLGLSDRKEEDDNEEVRGILKKDLKMIARNIIRLARVSSEILDASRIGSTNLVLNKEVFDLNELFVEAVDDAKNLAGEADVKFVLAKPDGKFFINADRGRIMQVVSNILNNAVKAIKHQGSIQIGIQEKETGEEDNRFVSVTIKDTGTGIDPEIMPRLFTKFVSGRASGTGLGLYISKAIVEAHGGKIWAENDKAGSGGAAFSFTLPVNNRPGTSE